MIYKILTGTMLLNYIYTNDVDKSFETFFRIIKSITDRHVPSKKMFLKGHKLKLKLWLTKGILILRSINNKNKTYQHYCRMKDQNRKYELYTLFKKYQNSLNSIIKVSKANHYHQYFTTNKGNLLKVWEGTKKTIHTKTKKQTNYKLSYTLYTKQKKIANSLNKFFATYLLEKK